MRSIHQARLRQVPLAVGGALLVATVASCSTSDGPQEVTTVVLDGQSKTLTGPVTCVNDPDGGLVILAVDGQKSVRVLMRRDHQFVAEKVGIRTDDARAFTSDSDQMWVSKIDDVYTISGRMPPRSGETVRRDFTVEVRCQHETTPYVPPNVP